MVKIPTKNERLFPGDEICVIGTDAQVNSRPICINTNLKLLKILKNGNYIATTGIKRRTDREKYQRITY
jgi:hypothetical protein